MIFLHLIKISIIKTFKIFTTVADLPLQWNTIALQNIFLSTAYLEVLQETAPHNMQCHFIGVFEAEELVGIALTQFLNLNLLGGLEVFVI